MSSARRAAVGLVSQASGEERSPGGRAGPQGHTGGGQPVLRSDEQTCHRHPSDTGRSRSAT